MGEKISNGLDGLFKRGLPAQRTLNGRRQLCPQLGAFRWLDFERRMQLQKPVVETRKSVHTLYRRFWFHKDLQCYVFYLVQSEKSELAIFLTSRKKTDLLLK